MAKIIIFGELDREGGLAWARCNGATRPRLKLHIADGITLDYDAELVRLMGWEVQTLE